MIGLALGPGVDPERAGDERGDLNLVDHLTRT